MTRYNKKFEKNSSVVAVNEIDCGGYTVPKGSVGRFIWERDFDPGKGGQDVAIFFPCIEKKVIVDKLTN